MKELHTSTPVDIVIDYLWSHPVGLIITALKGSGINTVTGKIRIVSVGSMAGENINLASGTLRSSTVELSGSGLGSLSKEDLQQFSAEVLPEMFQLAAEGKLTIEIENTTLENIETAWQQEISPGKRMVVGMA